MMGILQDHEEAEIMLGCDQGLLHELRPGLMIITMSLISVHRIQQNGRFRLSGKKRKGKTHQCGWRN